MTDLATHGMYMGWLMLALFIKRVCGPQAGRWLGAGVADTGVWSLGASSSSVHYVHIGRMDRCCVGDLCQATSRPGHAWPWLWPPVLAAADVAVATSCAVVLQRLLQGHGHGRILGVHATCMLARFCIAEAVRRRACCMNVLGRCMP
jgi:hypothetical protein